MIQTANQDVHEGKYIIYVLELAQGRYYVGRSTEKDIAKRIKARRDGIGKGAEWTKLFPVVREMT